MTKEEREIQRKLRVLPHAEKSGHVAKTCRYFGAGRSNFYRWRGCCQSDANRSPLSRGRSLKPAALAR